MFGLELHPAIVHYPIALSLVGSLAMFAYAMFRREWLRWFGQILLTIALAGAGAAYFSGESAHDRAADAGVPHEQITRHENTAIWSIGILALATLLAWATHAGRRGAWVAAPVSLLAVGMILWTGHLGGRLVFIYGAGRVAKSEVAPLSALLTGSDSTAGSASDTTGGARPKGHTHNGHTHTHSH